MRCLVIVIALLLTGVLSVRSETPGMVRVKADGVNLRARPALQAETIAQASRGDRLTARSFRDEWVEVAPPPDVNFFVHGDFVRDGVVDVLRLNVRAGPGINFSEVDTLNRGEKVTVVGEFADWLKIRPSPKASVWISLDYVEIITPEPRVIEPPAPTPAPTPPEPPPAVATAPPPPPAPTAPAPRPVIPPAPSQPPIAPTTPPPAPPTPPTVHRPAPTPAPAPQPATRLPPPVIVTPPPPPVVAPHAPPKPPGSSGPDRQLERMGLVPLVGQGRAAVYEGTLTRGGLLLIRPSRFRIVERGRGRVVTLAYVMGNEPQLESLVGSDLTIHGREYWLQGIRHPVLVAERIVSRQ